MKEFNGPHCTTILPFAGAKGNDLLPVGTTCVLEKLAALADRAASQFPAR